MRPLYHQSLFPSQGKKCLPPAVASRWMCFILGEIQGRRFTRVLGTQDAGALVLLQHASNMMDGVYYLNANKYRATNWLHFSSFFCCLWLLNDTKSSLRHITVLISSHFFLCSFCSVGQYGCAASGHIYVAASLACLHHERTVWCETDEVQSWCKSHLAQDSGAQFKTVSRFVFLAKLRRIFP